MTDETVWRLKVHAFLHDPPEKALILFEGGHAACGRELAERLVGPAPDGAEAAIRDADHLASAADREAFLRGAPDLRWSARPMLRHPLSGDEIDLGRWGWIGVEPDTARAEADRAVQELYEALATDRKPTPERVFWGLWRLLPDYLGEAGQGKSRIGALWEHLPAETRMPDHSIWDHQRLVSALTPILWQGQEPALLLISFGPVQRFIGTARRTADLWAGSFILSWLAGRAIVPLVTACGPDAVLFPALWRQPLLDGWLREGPLKLPVPEPMDGGRVASLPNRFLAVVPQEGARGIAEECLAALREEWRRLGERACDLFAGLAEASREKVAVFFDRQMPVHLETYWAAFPWPGDLDRCRTLLEARLGGGALSGLAAVDLSGTRQYRPSPGALYSTVYRAVDLTLGGVKAARFFESDQEPGPKCSLCGDREVVHPYVEPPVRQCKKWWAGLSERRRRHVGKGEALCAVCLVKRLALDVFKDEVRVRLGVPSTSEIAAAPFKLAVLGRFSDLRKEVAELVKAAQAAGRVDSETLRPVWRSAQEITGEDGELACDFARIDGECFWAGTEAGEEPEEHGHVSPEMARAARALVRAAERPKLEIPRPFQYLALVRMDGDDMGKWLWGDRAVGVGETLHPDTGAWLQGQLAPGHPLWQEQRRMTPATHAAISRACGAFALRLVPALLRERLAYLIYAGGDDLLALVSLDDVLGLVREVRLAFGGHMEIENGKEATGFNRGRGFYRVGKEAVQTFGRRAGLSGSLVVSHHKYPLQAAVEESRRAEEWAKKLEGKDALALSIVRRSGQATCCRIRWTNANRSADAVQDLQEISRAVRMQVLSPRFLSALMGLLRRPEAKALPAEAIELLARREVRRHWDEEQAPRVGVSESPVREAVWRLRQQSPCQEEWLGALEAAVFLARGGR